MGAVPKNAGRYGDVVVGVTTLLPIDTDEGFSTETTVSVRVQTGEGWEFGDEPATLRLSGAQSVRPLRPLVMWRECRAVTSILGPEAKPSAPDSSTRDPPWLCP